MPAPDGYLRTAPQALPDGGTLELVSCATRSSAPTGRQKSSCRLQEPRT
jgi:hypothetical protein